MFMMKRQSENQREYLYMSVGVMRVKAKVERSIRLTYTGLSGGLEHLKIKTKPLHG